MSEEKEKKLKQREKAFDYVFYIVLFFAVVVAILYWFNFRESSFSSKPEDWGVFGDYMGGTLNPLLAFFSFMLLLLNLKLQREQLDNAEEQLKLNREELAETRKALERSAQAQEESKKVIDEQLRTQTFQQSDNLFSVMFKQILDCQIQVVEECNRRKYYSDGNLDRLRHEINTKIIFKKYFRLIFQIFSMLEDILGLENTEKLKQYIKVIRSQQEDVVLEFLFIYISENREKPSHFHAYLRMSNFFKHLKLEFRTLKFKEVLKAYDDFNFIDKDEYFKKIG